MVAMYLSRSPMLTNRTSADQTPSRVVAKMPCLAFKSFVTSDQRAIIASSNQLHSSRQVRPEQMAFYCSQESAPSSWVLVTKGLHSSTRAISSTAKPSHASHTRHKALERLMLSLHLMVSLSFLQTSMESSMDNAAASESSRLTSIDKGE